MTPKEKRDNEEEHFGIIVLIIMNFIMTFAIFIAVMLR